MIKLETILFFFLFFPIYLCAQKDLGDYNENFKSNKFSAINPWSTFVGASDVEESYSSAVDNNLNTYVTGYTASTNFPTTSGVIQPNKQGFYDSFLTKLDTTGNVIWSTYYGGLGDEYGYEILTDSDDNVYLVGYTNGNDLLMSSSGVFQTISAGSYDSFILKLDSSGNFIWGTYFGGTGGDFAIAADIDNQNNIIIGGYTSSSDLQNLNGFQGASGGALDAFTAKFDSTGNLIWSTYCGGSNSEDVHTLHVDDQNNVIIAGETYSTDFPFSPSAFQTGIAGNLDMFIVKYDSLGNRIFSTYFGGFNNEDANGLSSDKDGNIYLVGYTESSDFPVLGSSVYQPLKNGGKDGFIVKFTSVGIPIRSTFLGGGQEDRFTCVEVSSTNALYVGGFTFSSNLPLIGTSYQNTIAGLSDGMYFKLDTALSPNYSTYIGGVSADYLNNLSIDDNQLLTFSGFSSSNNFPTTSNVFQENLAGQSDAFVFQSDSVFSLSTSFYKASNLNNVMSIYPNPCENYLKIEIDSFNSASEYKLEIYSLDGKLMISYEIDNQKEIMLELIKSLKPSLYFCLLLEDNNIIGKQKIIKE